ncbi:NUDIX hydrolase [Tessaracoccus palaemonis]|uniref:NUDIX hydrolase n=1 Tax=Tessaracoccus palaemonis TaxID=2829499 RepID=A0ABX8SK77_9ACTN|nr:NUDIX domain-containing protein [Tessaracoccus palaemonis]QXT61619.1 NUDIX hydrolase [Tessaracoccus palaemonis]
MTSSPDFPPFGVTADLVILTIQDNQLRVALVERKGDPFRGCLALPGGFISRHGLDDNLEQTALRELNEETGIRADEVHLEQLKTYWTRGRDPRQEVVTVAWLALGPVARELRAGTDAASAAWYPVIEALDAPLAFDHNVILRDGVERARARLEYTDIAATFLGPRFTIAAVREIYETVWGEDLDPGNFQRKMTGIFDRVENESVRPAGGRGRPAALFTRKPPSHRDEHGLVPIDPPFRRSSRGGE